MKGIEKVRAALEQIRDAMPETDSDYDVGWAHEYHLVAQEALRELDGMVLVPMYPDTSTWADTYLRMYECPIDENELREIHRALIDPYLPKETKE